MFVAFDSDITSHAPEIAQGIAAGRAQRRDARLRLRPGQILFHQGDDARSVYHIDNGVLRLTRVTERGRQQVIAFGYPGDIVGLPVQGLRSTDCEALTPATLTPVPARLPTERSGNIAEAAFLAAAALWEVGVMQEHLMTLGHKSSRERVSSFLVALMRRVGRHDDEGVHVDLPMSRSDIADFLGLRTETVSRAFTDLRQAGLIDLPSAQHVTIVRPDLLETFAEGD